MQTTRHAFDPNQVLARLKAIQADMRDALVAHMRRSSAGDRSAVAYSGGGDTIYALDRDVEHILLDQCRLWAREQSLILIAEGLGETGEMVLPDGAGPGDAALRIIFDPVDGTRGLMYDKRSAWILAGVAPNLGPGTSLADIVAAVQTEVPTTKQYLADVAWAVRGQGAQAERYDLLSKSVQPLALAPSSADTIAHGFASLSKFFPGRKPIVAEIEEEMIRQVDGVYSGGLVRVFDDQYISSGGQLYELMAGHDRFNGDIRPALMRAANLPGDAPAMAAHPYDLCTELIARESGVIVTDLNGRPLSNPLTVHNDVAWLGYANEALRARLEPVLQGILRSYGLI